MTVKEALYPRFSWKATVRLFILSVTGALIAGIYGVLHDQITYTLSPEYFTKFKFGQFHDADPGLGDRAFAGVIGFLATWWIGLIVGWAMGRLSMGKEHLPQPRLAIRGMLITFGTCVLFGVLGYIYGSIAREEPPESWTVWQKNYQIAYIADFNRVGCIHNMGYIGGVVGSILGGIYVRRKR